MLSDMDCVYDSETACMCIIKNVLAKIVVHYASDLKLLELLSSLFKKEKICSFIGLSTLTKKYSQRLSLGTF